MSNRSPDDLTCSGVKQRNPIGIDYRADQAEHKFPVRFQPASVAIQVSLLSALLPTENGESEFST
jgi:hypothetical protein